MDMLPRFTATGELALGMAIILRADARGCALGVFCQTQVWRRVDDLCR